MVKKLTHADVRALAHLARLTITDEECDHYVQELQDIFSYIDLLEEVDVTGTAPTLQVNGLTNVMRPDVVATQALTPQELLRNVPQTQDGYLKVRRMI